MAGSGATDLSVTAAVPDPERADREARKILGSQPSPPVTATVNAATVDILAFDLVISLGNPDGLTCPDLPGLPPLLTWELADIPAADLPAELGRRINALLQHGYLDALLSSRRNSELVLDNLQEGIIAHDLNRRIFFFNQAAERITGYRREEVLGHDCHQVFPGNFCGGKCSFCLGDCTPSLPDKSYSLRFTGRDGSDLHLEMHLTAITAPGGQVRGVVASFRDRSRELELAGRLGEIEQFAGIIGRDPKMQEMYQTIRELADSRVPVLITGESGTGKELVAAAVHSEGSRSNKLFVPVNCGALPENLLESELFGHVRGAFTGAIRDKKGRFELANGGTIFLDEIGDISLAMQVKLLRVLQNGTFHRVGGELTVHVDVRVVSATHKNLKAEIAAGRFREDLFYRLCVVPVHLPPLRERLTDIPLLIRHFIKLIAKEEKRAELTLAPETMDIFLTHAWPGNIRELQNVIRYLMVRCREEVVLPHHLPENLRLAAAPSSRPLSGEQTPPRRRLTLERVLETLAAAGGNRLKAARMLGVGRATLYRFLAQHPENFA
ncbi:MAG: sigma 54-interacting transcriptional regulator [Desulfobulbaceae bacterium]|nr:sigma 54-interacting transcriptional regulator [Desulfobulbaceae bacterium]